MIAATLRRLLREDSHRIAIVLGSMVAWFGLIMLVVRNADPLIEAKTQAVGSSVMRGFGIGSLTSPDEMIAQMAAVSFNHPIVLALVGALTISPAVRACQGELRANTLELTLTRPLGRTRYLVSVIVHIIWTLILLMLVTWASMVGFDRLLSVPGTIQPDRAAIAVLNGGLVFLGFAAVALLSSVVLARKGNAMFTSIGILVLMFADTFTERAWPSTTSHAIGRLSLFHWFDPGATLLGAPMHVANLLVPAAISAAGFLAAIWLFERRDV
jgi:hypothetical protein